MSKQAQPPPGFDRHCYDCIATIYSEGTACKKHRPGKDAVSVGKVGKKAHRDIINLAVNADAMDADEYKRESRRLLMILALTGTPPQAVAVCGGLLKDAAAEQKKKGGYGPALEPLLGALGLNEPAGEVPIGQNGVEPGGELGETDGEIAPDVAGPVDGDGAAPK